MSYAIIRNAKYKRENLKGIYRHNERKNKNYSNKNINEELSYLNYSLKDCTHSYEKEFDLLKEKYNLKGQIKTVNNIACEYIITSDKEFFDNIGEEETKRYFETAYKFVCEYKDLGEQYILSAKVHMDEESPHMHLVFIPVVHTKDKKVNDIDKIACSEFWKEKDSYRQLQDAFYNYIVSNNFELERGNPSERVHLSVEDYKQITNFENSKTVLQDIKLELPDVPDIKSFGKLMRNRDERIQELVINPKDKTIKDLQEQNSLLTFTLESQVRTVERALKYEKERKSILTENRELKDRSENMKNDYSVKLKEETKKIEDKYENKIYHLESKNNYLRKIINYIETNIRKSLYLDF
ncbi:MAG: MobV family relaxase [Clostridia bacterium]|nr:MobV family relaxase [Clostridia bacterium]